MLPDAVRMRRGEDFRLCIRKGRRIARGTLVLHAYDAPTSTLVGLVVSKRIGNAVTRNRVKRQLRHLVRGQLDAVGSRWIVVRALPKAAHEPTKLATDLKSALAVAA